MTESRHAAPRGTLLLAIVLGISGAGCTEESRPPEPDSHGRVLYFPHLRDMVYVPSEQDGGLLIDRFEVTDGEYLEFVRATGYRGRGEAFLAHWSFDADGEASVLATNHPVRFVSLEDARAYARWRNKAIPTREQWLEASEQIAGGRFPWPSLSVVDSPCNSQDFGWNEVLPVGVFPQGRSESNCYDLIGNVAEWVQPELDRLNGAGSQRARVMGGSFNTVLQSPAVDPVVRWPSPLPDPRSIFEPKPGVHQPFDLLSGRWLQVDERSSDVGFRCVLPGADRILQEALDGLDRLPAGQREPAIRELLSIGEHFRRDESNKLLPFASEREFRSRILWSVPCRSLPTVLRSPVPLDGRDDQEDLLVVVEAEVGEGHELQARSGRTGRLIDRVALPFSLRQSRGIVHLGEGGSWFWCQGIDGEIRWVTLPSLEAVDLPGPEGAPNVLGGTLVRPLEDEGGVLIVQMLETASTAAAEVADPADRSPLRCRLQWITAAGRRSVLELPGDFLQLRSSERGAVLLDVEERFSVRFFEPLQQAPSSLQPPIVSLTTYRIGLDSLSVQAVERLGSVQVVGAQGLVSRFDPWRRFMAAPPAPTEEGLLMAVRGEELHGEESRNRQWIDLVLLDRRSLRERVRERWEVEPGTVLSPSVLPGVWLGAAGGQPILVRAEDGRILRRVLPLPEVAEELRWWRDPATELVQPYLLSRSAQGRQYVHELVQEDGRWQLRVFGPREGLGALAKGRSLAPDGSMVFTFLSSDALAIAPGGEVLWSTGLGRSWEGAQLRFEASERGRDEVVLVGRSLNSLWTRSLESGELLERIEVRSPLRESVLADVDADRRREWILSTSREVVRPSGSKPSEAEHWLLALRRPRPESPEARLWADFRRLDAEGRGPRVALLDGEEAGRLTRRAASLAEPPETVGVSPVPEDGSR